MVCVICLLNMAIQTVRKKGAAFTDLDEQQAYDLLKQIDQALLLQQWITVDKRPDRTEEWMNILIRKVQA